MNRNFSENLKRIRKENNLSQEQLAEELGVSRQAISKWESGAAYPEMDKILFLCDRFNLNIDDLLHKDIKEAKGEEEARNNINKYIDDFFKFITDSINLFGSMTFKSKIKCLFEQFVLAFVLFIISSIFFGIISGILGALLNSILPFNIFERIRNYIYGLYSLAALVVGIIIMIKVFKTRYLDYYEADTTPKEKKLEKNTNNAANEKIVFKENDKIIIRDPQHSEYRFLHAIGKIVVFGIKLCTLWIEFFLLIGLVSIGGGIVTAFLVSKTGLFFYGIMISLLSAAIMDIIVILLLFNFIFNRKNDKKKMIWTFIVSTLLFGIGCGMTFIGTLSFDILDQNDNYESHTVELEMNDNSLFSNENINYVVEERNNIRVEYQTHPYYEISTYTNENGVIHLNTYCTNRMEELRYILKKINEEKIIEQNYNISNITIYTSEQNINKLKTNRQKYYDVNENYEKTINELREENNSLSTELRDKELEIERLQEEINEHNNIEG